MVTHALSQHFFRAPGFGQYCIMYIRTYCSILLLLTTATFKFVASSVADPGVQRNPPLVSQMLKVDFVTRNLVLKHSCMFLAILGFHILVSYSIVAGVRKCKTGIL